ncbi:MAG: zinc ribbon domain-containing protein [Stenomitos rutilans HA7619-LM2]|jgi:NADH pyrophosphatase NudC (nudix superfamily)|nr:zinc ribbon domain-containing protein [Stenomitos rutilans HA7619-LM2]
MGYLCDLGSGQTVYLENVQHQTLVTVASSYPGQQQQSSSGFQTGSWTAPPEVLRSTIGLVVKLYTDQGEWFISIQGSRLSVLNEAPSLAEAQPLQVQSVAHKPGDSRPTMPSIQPMPLMTPMPPMTMGNMQMDRNTMSMQMGSMHMSMNPIAPSASKASQTNTAGSHTADEQRNFCSQCGTAITPGDRFCAHCGHQLG